MGSWQSMEGGSHAGEFQINGFHWSPYASERTWPFFPPRFCRNGSADNMVAFSPYRSRKIYSQLLSWLTDVFWLDFKCWRPVFTSHAIDSAPKAVRLITRLELAGESLLAGNVWRNFLFTDALFHSVSAHNTLYWSLYSMNGTTVRNCNSKLSL